MYWIHRNRRSLATPKLKQNLALDVWLIEALLSGRGCSMRYSATVLQLEFGVSVSQCAIYKFFNLINRNPYRGFE